ncbi:MAG: HyaD/HybD family hydrogenase maturation endopeptidase [Chloroflexota bacterium]
MTENIVNRKIVMGLGNTLNRDEGLGVYALQALEAYLQQAWGAALPADLEFVDGGVLGLNLLPWVEECSHLLVLDAINARKEPGTLIELRREEIPLYTGIKMSDHQITFQEVLGLANFRGKLPERLHMIGIQPEDISIGVEVSACVAATMPQIQERAVKVLSEWGLLPEKIPVD